MGKVRRQLNKLQAYMIHFGLAIALTFLCYYLLDPSFRGWLVWTKIDPNFIIGFFTVIALFLSLIQGSKDKRYAYNLKTVESIEDKGLKVIGKLLSIKQKSEVILSSLRTCKKAMEDGIVFRDLNNTMLKDDIEADIELITTYLDTYFPEHGKTWNNLMDKLSLVATHNGNIILNYNENISLIEAKTPFKNTVLDSIDDYIKEVEVENEEIANLTFEIRNGVVEKINAAKNDLKENFNFKL